MAVVSGPFIRPGFPRAEFSLTSRKYTVQWLVGVDSYDDGPLVAQSASGLPAAYSTYAIGDETDIYARLREWSSYRLEENSLTWVVEAVWTTPTEKGGENRGTGQGTHQDSSGDYTNPLNELPVLKTSIFEREVVIDRIYNIYTGNFNPPMNSACEVYNPPPMKKQVGLVISITRNEAVSTLHPALGVSYSTAVNADTFWGLPPGQVQCQSISAEQQTKQVQGGTQYVYLRVEYVFHAIGDGWDLFILDAGDWYCCNNGSGSGSQSGCYLPCGSGSGLAPSGSGYEPPLNCPWCTTKTAFIDDKGHPIKGLLNGQGGKLPPNCNPVYQQVRPYNWLPFSALNLPQSWSGVQ
jgi:hypothetical protein